MKDRYGREIDYLRISLTDRCNLRCVYCMPLGTPAEIALHHYVSSAESSAKIEAELGPLFPLRGGAVVGEARLYRLPGASGTIGFISPVSDPYCDSCSRLRLTADGHLRLCLLAEDELDLRDTLRNGGSHRDLVDRFRQAIWAKPRGCALQQGLYPENRTMSQVGDKKCDY